MKKVLFIIIIIFILLLGVAFMVFNVRKNAAATATIDGHTLNLLIAKTDTEKRIGLSSRTSLDPKTGMIFPFDHADYYTFWMRDMKFPIDIIFIKGNRIVTIYKNVAPPNGATNDVSNLPTYKPQEPADTVLEVQAGLSETDNFKVGDTVNISGVDTQSK